MARRWGYRHARGWHGLLVVRLSDAGGIPAGGVFMAQCVSVALCVSGAWWSGRVLLWALSVVCVSARMLRGTWPSAW